MKKIFITTILILVQYSNLFSQKNIVGVDFTNIFIYNFVEFLDTINVTKRNYYNFTPSVFYSRMLPNKWQITFSAGGSFNNSIDSFNAIIDGTTNRVIEIESFGEKNR